MKQTDRNNGYTLIEMVIVVLVMGILFAVAAPRYREATVRFCLQAAAKRMVADIHYVRNRAMSRGAVAEEQITFSMDTDEYQLLNTPDMDHPDQEFWVHLADSHYSVDLFDVSFTNNLSVTSDQILRYDRYGIPKTGTSPSAQLVSGTIVINCGSESKTILINPATGKASIQ